MRHALAGVCHARNRHAVHFAPDFHGFFARLGTRRNAHGNLVRLGRVGWRCCTMNRIEAQKIHTHVLGLEVHDLEALLQNFFGQLGTSQCAGARVKEHVFANESFRAAHRHLERRRARLAGQAGDAHSIRSDLFESRLGEINHHIRREVVGGIVHLVEHLLLHGLQRDRAAGARHLGDHHAAIGIHLGNRECKIPGLGNILETRVRKVASGDLRAAFHQVPNGAACTNLFVIERIPAELIHHRCNEQRRVGHAARHHYLRTVFERLHDGLGAHIGLGRNQRVFQRGGGLSVFHDRGRERQHPFRDQAAADRGHLHARNSHFAQQFDDALRGPFRVDPALVGDDARAAFHACRKHRAHSVIEIGVVARKGRVASGAHLRGRHGGFGHGFKTQVVEIAFFGVQAGGLHPVTPPRRT